MIRGPHNKRNAGIPIKLNIKITVIQNWGRLAALMKK
jgi:hypothetical protein